MRHILLIGTLLLLAGCATPLKELEELNPQADDYANSLASEYLAYAKSESEQGRQLTAEFYANKGLRAAHGESVLPETPAASLSKEDQQMLATARADLVPLLTEDVKSVAPQKLARAQLLFDCWQHQLNKRINQERAPCADEFVAAMTELRDVSDSFQYEKETPYVLSFAAGKAVLDSEGRAILSEVAKKAATADDYMVEIEIREAVGSVSHKLAEKRLGVIKRRLISEGVPGFHIQQKKEDESKKVCISCNSADNDSDTAKIRVKVHKQKE